MLAATAAFALLSTAIAAPVARNNIVARGADLGPYNGNFQIDPSCNSTQHRVLTKALDETKEIAIVARNYLQEHGPNDLVKQYFGDTPRAWSTAIGVYQSVVEGNKNGAVFRCDDIDGNCHQDGWYGHWRGDNATSETVICDRSYTGRSWNVEFCLDGFQLATSKITTYWSIDLLHRVFHIPQVTNAAVDHFAEDLVEVYDNAEAMSTFSPWDSDALQYFAAHVYILSIGGGDSCLGDIQSVIDKKAGPKDKPTPDAGGKDCHTHADGTVHCTGGDASAADKPPAPLPSADAGKDCHSHADGTIHCTGDDAAAADKPPAPLPSAESSDDCHTHADGSIHCSGDDAAPPAPSTTAAPEPSASSGGEDCHTHADGTEHCGSHDAAPEPSSAPAPAPAPAPSSGGEDCHTHADGTEHCGSHDAAPAPAPAPSAAGDDCHTHADGTVHCGAH